MSTLFAFSIYGPLFAIGVLLLVSHCISRACFLSHLARSNRLFSEGPWLPLRIHDTDAGTVICSGNCESVRFTTVDGLTLDGSYFPHNSSESRGTIVYFHEMNGNRWSVLPYIEKIRGAGFNLFTFDQRGHGDSDSCVKFHPTPWVMTSDLEDIRAAIDFVQTRFPVQGEAKDNPTNAASGDEIGVFGLGKGATLALCCASLDSRVRSVVMDSPAPEGRIYERNCFTSFTKSGQSLLRHHFSLFIALLAKTVVYLAACPFFTLMSAWRRFMLSLWCGGRFVNTWSIIKNLRKPILIVHGDMESCVSLPQIRSFCQRMSVRPRICLVHPKDDTQESPTQVSADWISDFFAETLGSGSTQQTTLVPTKEVGKRKKFFNYRATKSTKYAPLSTK